jgi:hypothetical protein
MASDDQLNSTPSMIKRPISRKHRVVTHNQTTENNGIARLPSLLSKSSVFLSSFGILLLKFIYLVIQFVF